MQSHATARTVMALLACLLVLLCCFHCDARGKTKPSKEVLNFGTDPNRSNGRTVARPRSIDLRLKVPFTVLGNGKVAVAVPSDVVLGDPSEAFERPFLIYPGKDTAFQIGRMEDLKGRVRISSPEQALAFCRLRTSPVTWYLLGDRMEVVERGQVNADFCFGDENERKSLMKDEAKGYSGIVESKAVLSQIGVSPASTSRTGTGYTVKRTLVEFGDEYGKYNLVDAVEQVGKDGSYKCTFSNKRPAPEVGGLQWMLPRFM